MELDQVRFAIIAITAIVGMAAVATIFIPDNQMLSNIIMGAVGAIAGLAGNTAIITK